MELNVLSSKIIKAAINVHKELGPGLLESVYQKCLVIELKLMGLEVESEIPLPVNYKGQKVDDEGFRIDLLVEDKIIVELKSVEKIQKVYPKQLLTYLRLANKQLGLLINFNEVLLKDGISRIINAPQGLEDCSDFFSKKSGQKIKHSVNSESSVRGKK
jgi:GxxExxY protein